jgi:hypothetical protein
LNDFLVDFGFREIIEDGDPQDSEDMAFDARIRFCRLSAGNQGQEYYPWLRISIAVGVMLCATTVTATALV